MTSTATLDLSQAIAGELPYLRRYARALTGSQTSGDAFAVATLESLLVDPSVVEAAPRPKVGLFHAFHLVWASAGAPGSEATEGPAARAQALMAGLTPNSREALLLQAIEGFSQEEIGAIMQIETDEVATLIAAANDEMTRAVTGRVMVIEDEAIIAMDLVDIVTGVGHEVTGTARTRAEAVELARKHRPDLILSDIQLADNSSGIDAVNDILREIGEVPVIFITAFPERLLTGEKPEPAFLITKPFSEEQVRSAVSQAMFFASTETLAG
ncbi:response regulator [Rhodobacter maris]|uniref:Response regulator receiver domain-containing protein n=1 Tax=Rhodobacter maris TaxID=446682 RepID=A0A285RXI1_9RHOB|nr:response regulator [Rhodobacter maris]SOB99281.1 response regulator receiver domain-containing protein [Rhodobacter maris]